MVSAPTKPQPPIACEDCGRTENVELYVEFVGASNRRNVKALCIAHVQATPCVVPWNREAALAEWQQRKAKEAAFFERQRRLFAQVNAL